MAILVFKHGFNEYTLSHTMNIQTYNIKNNDMSHPLTITERETYVR